MKTVCCVMLANGREAMVPRAVRAWEAQTYDEKHRLLLILDTGADPLRYWAEDVEIARLWRNAGVIHVHRSHPGMTIGALRNEANRRTNAEILVHWDSDDWSHPNRLAEQVELLEASGKEAVGYRDMLFWSTAHTASQPFEYDEGEAWLYTNRNTSYCLGTSLCYWRDVWQRHPFPETSAGEDTLWIRALRTAGDSFQMQLNQGASPRMIASIHGANTYARIDAHAEEWRRAPEWDEHCRATMAL